MFFCVVFDVRVGFSGFGLAPFFPWVVIGELDCLESVSVIYIGKKCFVKFLLHLTVRFQGK